MEPPEISLVIDLSDALASPPPPLTILGTATDAEIAAAISIDDTTNRLVVIDESSSIDAIIPSTNRFEVGLAGAVHHMPGSEITVSEVGYRH